MLPWIIASLIVAVILVLGGIFLIDSFAVRRLSLPKLLFILGAVTVVVSLSSWVFFRGRVAKSKLTSDDYVWTEGGTYAPQLVGDPSVRHQIETSNRARAVYAAYAFCVGIAFMLLAGILKLMRGRENREVDDDKLPESWLE